MSPGHPLVHLHPEDQTDSTAQ